MKTLTQMEYQNIRNIVNITWDGDVTFKEFMKNAGAELNMKEINELEEFLGEHHELLEDGIPFPGDNKEYDVLLKHNTAAQNLQKLINLYED